MNQPDKRDQDFDALALLIGRVNVAWGLAYSGLHMCFALMTATDHEMAHAIFFAVKSDSAQRDMTLAAASVFLKGDPILYDKTKKLIDRLGVLSGERNAAVHTLWINSSSGLVPSPIARHHGLLDIANHRTQFAQLKVKIDGIIPELGFLFGELATVFEQALRKKVHGQSHPPKPTRRARDLKGVQRNRKRQHQS